jgi:hypothetical protein
MHHILIVITSFIATASDNATATTPQASYNVARSQAGKDPNAHVSLALWCEAHGLLVEKLKHLAIAVMLQPNHPTARGLMGLLAWEGKWRRPDAVAGCLQNETELTERLAAYRRKRAKIENRADDHWNLALWCEENGLSAEAQAHLTVVVRLDPSRESAWRRLGCRQHRGRWMTEAQISAENAERKAQQAADHVWLPRLERWRSELRSDKTRALAVNSLATVTDPRALRSVWRVFGQGAESDQLAMAQLLGQIESPASTRSLAFLAVLANSSETRRRATEALAWRDPRDAAPLLISLLQPDSITKTPNLAYRYLLKPTGQDFVGSPGYVVVETPWFDWISRYTVDEGFTFVNTPSGPIPLAAVVTSVGGPIALRVDYESRVSQQRSRQIEHLSALLEFVEGKARDIAITVFEDNTKRRQYNEQIAAVLKSLTKQDLGTSREAWRKWWVEELGYAYEPPRPEPAMPYFFPKPLLTSSYHLSCFVAGTAVHTRSGQVPIERVRVGDQVLAQDTTTGALAYRPVVASVQNPPSETLRILTTDGEVVTTDSHRFWVPGRGWVMARSLKAGDQVRAIDHLVRITGVRRAQRQRVYNLEVLDAHDFFVGRSGFLVHDNSVVLPVISPFDARERLTAGTD